MSPFLQIERDGGVVTVRMNHPETRNALTTPEQIQEFVDLCAQLRRDPTVRAMALTGDAIDAAKALEWGLVEQVCTHEALQSEAQALARRIASNPGHALRLCKRLLREGQHMRLDSLLELSAAYQALAHHTEDHHEAVAAFVDKRHPNCQDR